MAEPPPTYTREEMDAILKRALERQQAKSEGIAHEDLVAAAGEVGIPREDVEAAARDLEAERAGKPSEGAPEPGAPRNMAAPDAGRARALRKLAESAMTYFALTMFFLFICRETGGNWWVWPTFGLGLSLVVQAIRVIFGEDSIKVGVFFLDGKNAGFGARPPSRREQRRARRADRLAEFEQKVAIGADALIRVIEEAKGVKSRLEAEHAKHVGGRQSAPEAPTKEQGPRVLVTPPPVRVDARDAEEVERDASAGSRREARR